MADVKQGGSGTEMARSEGGAAVAGSGAVQQAMAVMSQVQTRIMSIPPQRRVWLMGALLFPWGGPGGAGVVL